MKRHPALIPLSHDHHHGLVQARRLRRAASTEAAERREAATAFLRFFVTDTRWHFRDEEERLFPILAGDAEPATALLTRALLEHQQLHALARELEHEVGVGDVSATRMQRLADALEEHIRFEERTLFPLIETTATEGDFQQLQPAPDTDAPAEPLRAERGGPVWGTETEDLNATLLEWPPGAGPSEHVNSERDILVVVLAGSVTVTIEGEARAVDAGQAITIEKGTTRRIAAGPEGARYLSVHVRRPPLQISRAPG